MSNRAWAYIWVVFVVSMAYVALAFQHVVMSTDQITTLAILTLGATLTQLNKVEAPNHVAFFATPLFLFAGAVLLNPLFFCVLVAVPHLCEWVVQRLIHREGPHLRAWYIQPFNIAKHILAGAASAFVYQLLALDMLISLSHTALIPLLITAIAYLLVNQGLLGGALVLARNMSWRDAGVFNREALIRESVLMCLGVVIAGLWAFDRWLILPALTPLALSYQALRLPLLQQEAQTDSKTNLFTPRHFNRLFSNELDRAQRFDRPMALIMADLDLLRNVNNTYGHLIGDQVIQQVGQIFRTTTRNHDIAGRFGGEEFVIVLPETSMDEALMIAERLRQAVETSTFVTPPHLDPLRVTMSFGIASFPDHGTTPTDLTRAADIAVYQAKLQGRNRVVSAADVPHSLTLAEVRAPEHLPAAREVGGTSTPEQAERAEATQSRVQIAAGQPAKPAVAQQRAAELPPDRGAVEPAAKHVGTQSAPRLAPSQKNSRLNLFVACVIGAGLVVALVTLPTSPLPSLQLLALLVVLAAGAEFAQISVYGESAISVSLALTVVAALVAGVPGVNAVSIAIVLADQLRQKRPLRDFYKVAFNWSTHLLAGSAIVAVMHLAQIPLHVSAIFPLVLIIAVATLIYYVIETGLISVAISLSKRAPVLPTWQAQFQWLAGHYVVLGVMGLFLSIAYSSMGLLGVIVFAVPVGMMRVAQQQYVVRTQDHVRELKRVNTELTQANHEVKAANQSIETLNDDLKQLNDELFHTLGTILDARDPYANGHAVQVAAYAASVGMELGLPAERIEILRQSGFLHDIGKIAISEHILNKPERLTEQEYEYIKQHAVIGAQLLETSTGLRHLSPFIHYHHERWDGQGYPAGLSGENIPLEARILNVCDSVEAMASDRPYHKGMATDRIVTELQRCAGTQFDPIVAKAFIRVLEREGTQFVVNSAHQVERKQGTRKIGLLPSSLRAM